MNCAATYKEILELEEAGILGPELCPTPDYWHWAILKPYDMPEHLAHYNVLGEVRW